MPPREKKKKLAAGTWTVRVAIVAAALGVVGGASWAAAGCSGWDPREPFHRNAPEVDKALAALDAGELESAADFLVRYLGTGACTDGGIGLPDLVRQRPNGSFDLGLTLFGIAERFGHRFGDEELSDGGAPEEQQQDALRGPQIDCALVVVKAIAADPSVPMDLRARAYYLAGNLEFLRKKYEDAVKLYDEALEIVPGTLEEAGGDGVGRDAAWNRAIALRRIEEEKDAGPPDASPDASDEPDASPDAGEDGGDGGEEPDAGGDAGGEDDGGQEQDGGDEDDGGPGDAGQDSGSEPDSGSEADAGQPEPEEQPPPAQMMQDDRILDQLEEAPTYQEQEAKNRAALRRGTRTMEDK